MDIFEIGIETLTIPVEDRGKTNPDCHNPACGSTSNASCTNDHNRCMGSSDASCSGTNDPNACT